MEPARSVRCTRRHRSRSRAASPKIHCKAHGDNQSAKHQPIHPQHRLAAAFHERQAQQHQRTDAQHHGAGGLEALRHIKSQRPEALVIVVTGYGTVQSAVQAMKNGAYEYVTKPFSIDELKLLLERVSNHLKLKSENRIA